MSLINANHVIRLVLRGNASGQEIVNVLHYVPLLEPIPPNNFVSQYSHAFTFAIDRWKAIILPHLSSTYTLHGASLRVIEGKAPLIGVIPPGQPVAKLVYGDGIDADVFAPNTGGVIGEASPTFVAATIRKITGRAGKKWKGSMRLGPIAEASTDNNLIKPVPYASLVDDIDGIMELGPLTVGGNEFLRLSVFSLQDYVVDNNGSEVIPAQTAQRVTSVTVNQNLGSQVSRKPRRLAF